MSRNCRGGRPRANSMARASGVWLLRNRATRISARNDHFGCRQTASTKAVAAVVRCRAFTIAVSVMRGFSNAGAQTRLSLSSSNDAATICEERRASEILSPRLTDATLPTSSSSATCFRSAAAEGVRENCINSNVYNSRITRSAMRRGVRGWTASARRTFRDFMTPASWEICSISLAGR